MKLVRPFLESKVARRIFFLFVLCALLPIGSLAVFSFGEVTRQLYNQTLERLRQTNKGVAMGVLERLLMLEAELQMAAANVDTVGSFVRGDRIASNLGRHFQGVARIAEHGSTVLIGDPIGVSALPPSAAERIAAGETVVVTVGANDGRADGGRPEQLPVAWRRIVMFVPVPGGRGPSAATVAGELDPYYLWFGGQEDSLPSFHEVMVVDADGQPLFSSLPRTVPEPLAAANHAAAGHFEWSIEGEPFLGNYRTIPMRLPFGASDWIIVLSHSRTAAMSLVATFRTVFPLVVLMSLWVVLLLSISQIRRSLVPLERLQRGTRRIAARDFDSRVAVDSGDEFEELAESFNRMAERLGRQFSALSTIAEIDRAVLTTLDIETIVDTLLRRTSGAVPCAAVSVTLMDPEAPIEGICYFLDPSAARSKIAEPITLSSSEVTELAASPGGLSLTCPVPTPSYIAPLVAAGLASFRVQPIVLDDALVGILCLGGEPGTTFDLEDVAQARQLADQVALALANARLVEDLDEMNWGTLRALARAIDAKSPWTAGHSERVTELALEIGRQMQMPDDELETLQRGALLHDIGKLGTPAEILDKGARLDQEELARMREHPRIGAEILQPIPAFRKVIPIVLQHHEWYDGSGYPQGLSGNAINIHARVFAVADVYDAMTSERPYRDGLSSPDAIDMILQRSGTQFDPTVVDAFLQVMTRRGLLSTTTASDTRSTIPTQH